MDSIFWKTEKRKIKELIPFAKNPRKINEKEKRELRESLEKFSLAEPIVINLDNTLIGGHQRVKILGQLLGQDTEIDVRVPDRQLTKEEVYFGHCEYIARR